MKPSLNPALRQFWLTPARTRVLYGGRSSSKSWDAAGWAVFLATQCRVRVLCARQFQNKIAESVYTLIKVQIERFGLNDQFIILENTIRHKITGSEFIFYGLWRHIEEIKSLEGIDLLWLEEAHALTAEQWDILKPTIRKEGSQILLIFNPRYVTDFVYRQFVRGTKDISLGNNIFGEIGGTIKRHINYTENPFLSSTALKDIEALKLADEESYRHVYLGEPKTDEAGSIIRRSWVMAAIDAHKKLGVEIAGARRIGFDIADGSDQGENHDANATVRTYGVLVEEMKEWKAGSDELLKSATKVYTDAIKYNCDIIYDGIGVGAYAGSTFANLNREHKARIKYNTFNAGGKVINPSDKVDANDPHSRKNKDHFSNLKAQMWYIVADRLRHTYNAVVNGAEFDPNYIISICSECDYIERVADELSSPRNDIDMAGRAKVESKKDMKKRGIESPNIADAFIMAFAQVERQVSAPVLVQF